MSQLKFESKAHNTAELFPTLKIQDYHQAPGPEPQFVERWSQCLNIKGYVGKPKSQAPSLWQLHLWKQFPRMVQK